MAQKATPKAIKDDLIRYYGFIQQSLDERVANRIADAVIKGMLDLISKGISPIEGNGRFPAYKWAAFRNALKKEKSSINKALKQNKKALFKFRRMNQRQLLVAQKEMNRKSLGSSGQGYPFSVQDKYPGKKPRPVNLFLSGAFLSSLKANITGAAGNVGIEIGFFPGSKDAEGVEAYLKEQGHREGANTQPERPIIPIGTEDFAQTIQNSIWKIIEEAIDQAALIGPS